MTFLNRIIQFFLKQMAFGAGIIVGFQILLRALNLRAPRPFPHQFAKILDHPWRMRYRHQNETLSQLGIQPTMTVLELGCGTGTFTSEIARMIGPKGRLHAVDLQPSMLSKAAARITQDGLVDRVNFHCCGAYALPFEADKFDLVIIIATLSEIPDKMKALGEVRRVLKPNARLAISEELLDPSYVLPSITQYRVEEAGFEASGKSGSRFCYHTIFFNLK